MKNLNQKVITLLAIVGIAIGVLGFVRTGSIVTALAVLATAIRQDRKIERYLAITIGVALLIVAFVLPHGR